ncbi:ROK family protein [Enterobacter cloacae]|nr:ROK family protein [Enterobacter cloacae]MBF4114238.1 ROK family protein [Enterobacter cloacae]
MRNDAMQLFIGFDVGGTHIKHGVIDEKALSH